MSDLLFTEVSVEEQEIVAGGVYILDATVAKYCFDGFSGGIAKADDKGSTATGLTKASIESLALHLGVISV